MKAKTFENLIRKVVREEIDYALRREIKSLKEDLRDEIKPTIIETKSPIVANNLKEKIMGTPTQQIPKKSFKPKQFTSNNTLNDLLNETAMGDTSLGQPQSPVSMEGNFNMAETPINTIGNMPIESAPKEVADAVTRDYSSLMKAINKKKNK